MLHPRYLLGALNPDAYDQYKTKTRSRALMSYKAMSEMMITNALVKIKDAPPYTPELENKVLLNSMARTTYDAKNRNYSFTKLSNKVELDVSNVKVAEQALSVGQAIGVGVDQGTFCFVSSTFDHADHCYRADLCRPVAQSDFRLSQLY